MTNITIEGIILAGGYSSRAGTFKMALPFGEKSLLEMTITPMATICSRIIIVGGHKFEELNKILEKPEKAYPVKPGVACPAKPEKIPPQVAIVFNANYPKGMFSSVQEGARFIKAASFFLIPGDYPLVSEATYQTLRKALTTSDEYDVFIPVHKGRKGHPVLLRGHLAAEIIKEPVDSTLRNIINRNRVSLVEVNDKGILRDIDTIEEYEKVKGAYLK
ncbi:MAG: nucleotidyltransferase family protein [bacterium]|nr:nucleotidyltransferase family protein [bacterium]